MAKTMTRAEILGRLRAKVARGGPVVGAGADTGPSAHRAEADGLDFLVVHNSGRGSLAGMLAYGNANRIVRELAPEILSAVKQVPVLAGVCGTDPFLLRGRFLRGLRDLGFAGIQNFPTVGLIDGRFRENLEETGLGFGLEVELIAEAHALGLLTAPYAFDPSEARRMAEAGADVVVAHMGLSAGDAPGAWTPKALDACLDEVRAIADACKSVRADCLVLCHGGPIATPDDARYILDRCRGVEGYYGATAGDQARRVATKKRPTTREDAAEARYATLSPEDDG